MFDGFELQFPVDFIEKSKLESEGRDYEKNSKRKRDVKKNVKDVNEFGMRGTALKS